MMVICVISRRDLPVFTQTEVPPLLLTTHNAVADARARFAGLADVYDCSAADTGSVDLAVAVRNAQVT